MKSNEKASDHALEAPAPASGAFPPQTTDAITPPPPQSAASLSAALVEQRGIALAAQHRARVLAHEIEALRASTSWRITAPLRWFSDRIKGAPSSTPAARRSISHRLVTRMDAWLPLPAPIRRALHRGLYVLAPSAFAGLQDYEDWKRRRNAPQALATLRFDPVDDPAVTIVIPTYGQLEMTLACLASIARHPSQAAVEVLVVEDASGDMSMQRLAQIPGLRFVTHPQNLGFLRSCNAASRLARGEYLCFLNNDTEVEAGWLDAMLSLFRAQPGCGLVGAQLVYPDGRLQEAGGIVWNDGSAWNYGRLERPDGGTVSYVKETDYCSGAAMVLPRTLFERLGGFDELYLPAYYEDTDLAFKVRAQGLKVFLQPAARVVHHEGQSHGTDVTAGVKAHQVENQAKFQARWSEVLARENFPPGMRLHLAKDART